MSPRQHFVDLRPLRRSRAYRGLWASTSLSALGMQVTNVAVLYQVWELTGNPFWVGAVGLVHALPLIVFGLLGGTLADAVDRRVLVLWTTAGQVLAAAGLAVQALLEVGSLVLLLSLVAVQSACGGMGAPARRTFPPRLLPRELVAAGIALQMLSFQGALLIGPAAAGLVIGAWGLPACYTFDALTFGVSAYAVRRLPSMPPEGAGSRPGPRAMLEGFRLIRAMPVLRGSFLSDLAATVLAMPIAMFPVVNEVRYGGDPETLGFFFSAVAVGGICAGLLSGAVTRARYAGRVQLWAASTWGLGLAGFGLLEPIWLTLGCLVAAGAADTVSVTSRGAMVQLATPDSHRGRVSSVDHVVGVAGPDIGNFRAGLVAGWTSAPVALVSGGLLCVVGTALVALTHRPLRQWSAREAAGTNSSA